MIFISRIVLLIILFLSVSEISAQQIIKSTNGVYGLDPLLYNGKYYTFFPPLNTGGTQYFTDHQFESGSVTIRGIAYADVVLNYDIYNQQLLLKYKNNLGAISLIIISDAWLESFSFKGLNFEVFSQQQDTTKRIFQVLGTGPNRILYYWKKDLILDGFHGSKNHIFTAARKEMNIFTDNKIVKYRNNKIFYSQFDTDTRNALKKYLKKNNINVKKASDKTMTELIHYCNTINAK
jgi:hypothetical protein